MSTDPTQTPPQAGQPQETVPPEEQVEPHAAPVERSDPNLASAVQSNPANTPDEQWKQDMEERFAQVQRDNEALQERLREAEQRAANPAAASATRKRPDRLYIVPDGVHTWDALMQSFDKDVRNADNAPSDVASGNDLFTYNRDDLTNYAQARGFSLQYVYDQPSDDPSVPPRSRIGYHVFPGEPIRY